MESPKHQSVKAVPIITLLMMAAALIIAGAPSVAPWLIFDRAAILDGQVWRLFTGHWVHFSGSHLLYDLVALAVIGWIIESKSLPRFGSFCLITPFVISIALLVFEPSIAFFGGLSGLATGALVFLILSDRELPPVIRLAVGMALIGKMICESIGGHALFASVPANVRSAVASHIWGAAAGALISVTFQSYIRRIANSWLLPITESEPATHAQNPGLG